MAATIEQALAELQRQYTARTPNSRKQFALAEQRMPAGNTRNNLFFQPYMPFFERADGAVLTDIDGNQYVDLLNDFTVCAYGHSNRVLIEAAISRLSKGVSLGACTPLEMELAEELQQRLPSMDLLRFANSGTEANIYALQAALLTTGRKKILVFDGNYHGGILNYCHQGAILNLPVETIVLPYNELAAFDQAMAEHGDSLGAVIMELMMNTGGCIPADPDFVRRVRSETARAGVPLIVDEVMTARLAYGGMQALYGIRADMTTLGKMIGGGFSAGAFGGKRELMQVYDGRKPNATVHGGSFNNNVMSMTVGLAALREVLTADALQQMSRLGDALRDRLTQMFKQADLPLTVTGYGSVLNVHYGRAMPKQVVRDPRDKQVQTLFHRYCLVHGYWVATRALLSLSVDTTQALLDSFVDRVAAMIDEYGGTIRALEVDDARTGTY